MQVLVLVTWIVLGGCALVYAQSSIDAPVPGYVDPRFKPVGAIPQALIDQQEAAKKISITISGSSLRSDVAAGMTTVQGWDTTEQKVTADPDKIRVKEDLAAYAQAIVLSDQNISSLSIQQQSITMVYQSRGELFGFIPMGLVATIIVAVPNVADNTAGQLEVHLPWYAFLMKKQFTASTLNAAFAPQAQLINSQDETQKIAQYLGVMSVVVKK